MKGNEVSYVKESNVRHDVVSKTDPSFKVVAGLVLIQNQGTSRVLLDNHYCLDPLEFFRLEDTEGGAIVHSFSIEFITNPAPPTADSYRIWNGDRVVVTTVERKIY